MNDLVLSERKNRRAIITLNRPEKRNALNGEMVTHLLKRLHEAEEDPEVKVVILKANGPAFCSGADLEYLQQLQKNTYAENVEDSMHLKSLFYRIYTLKKPVIAQVHGHAIAGGCGLATVCDFVYTVPEAKFGYTEVRIGFVPALVMVFLLRKIGEAQARRLLLTGELFGGEEACSLGLVNACVTSEDLENAVENLAETLITKNSGQSMALVKEMLAKAPSLELEDALDYAAETNARARETKDCKKGISHFLNKEPINW
jgi:methylglutaconyl-CoA hydratase